MGELISLPAWMHILLYLFTPIVGFCGIIAANYFQNKRSKKEILFKLEELSKNVEEKKKDRQLAVIKFILPLTINTLQEAFYHVMEINRILPAPPSEEAGNEKAQEKFDKICEKLREIREWYDKNSIYLPNEMRRLFLEVLTYSNPGPRGTEVKAWVKITEFAEKSNKWFEEFNNKYNPLEI